MEQKQRSNPSKENKKEGLEIKPVLATENLEGSEHITHKEQDEDQPVHELKKHMPRGKQARKE